MEGRKTHTLQWPSNGTAKTGQHQKDADAILLVWTREQFALVPND